MSFYNRVYVCSSVECRDERERPPARSQDIQFPFQPSLELEIVISATLYPRVTSRVSTLTLYCTVGRAVRGCLVAFWRGQVWPGPAIMAGRTCHARQRTSRVLIVLGPGKAWWLCGMARPPRINYNMIYVYKIIFVPVSICRGREEDVTPGKSRKFQVTAVFRMYLSVRLVALQLAGTFYLRHRV